MSNHAMTAENLLAVLPSVLQRDEKMYALAEAIAGVLVDRQEEIQKVAIYRTISTMDDELLNILANDLKVDWYAPEYPIKIRQSQVANSVKVHRLIGTKAAIDTALSDIYPNTNVQEWFEYNGQPYHFRILLDVGEQVVDIPHKEIVKSIYYYKSLRSALDDIYYRSTCKFGIRVNTGYVIYDTRRCGTYPVNQTEGAITDGGITIDTDASGVSYCARMCGSTPGSLL